MAKITTAKPFLAVDYSRCPSGQCKPTEYRMDGLPFGIQYGCLGPKATQGEGGGQWCRHWSMWGCPAASAAYRAMLNDPTHRMPDAPPELGEHARAFRASLRPAWMR